MISRATGLAAVTALMAIALAGGQSAPEAAAQKKKAGAAKPRAAKPRAAKPPAAKPPAAGAKTGKPAASGSALARELGSGARLDWSRGLLIARGAAAGDLRAPSPNVARLAAERSARDAARARLRDLANDLPLAGGRSVGEVVAADSAAAARLAGAVERTVDLDIDLGTDGSVVLSAGLPLEAVRAALYGPSPVPTGRAKGAPTTLVVDAAAHLDAPLLGLSIAAGDERYQGPTLFAARRPDRKGDPRIGARPVLVRAKGHAGGALELAGAKAASAVKRAREAGALIVIVYKENR
jgi:hypothetical protein